MARSSDDLEDMLDEYQDQEKMYNYEGRRGVENLVKIVRAIGYEDSMHFGQLKNGSIGDLIEFFEDNSGAIEAVISWIGKTNILEWRKAISEFLPEEEEEEE